MKLEGILVVGLVDSCQHPFIMAFLSVSVFPGIFGFTYNFASRRPADGCCSFLRYFLNKIGVCEALHLGCSCIILFWWWLLGTSRYSGFLTNGILWVAIVQCDT